MARALLVALAWCAVRGEEYGGGAMPQYGGADYERGALTDDYRGHSPDAPAPLDYKYEEEQPGDTEKSAKYAEDADRWRRPEKTKRRPARDDIKQDDNDANADSGPSSKVDRRHTRRRARGRRDEPRRRGRADRRLRADQEEEQLARYLDNIDYRDDRSRNVDDDDRIPPRETTTRFIRRKPRDRKYAPQPGIVKSSGELVNQEFISNRGSKDDKSDESDYWTGDDSARPPVRMRPMLPESDTDVESTTKQRGRPRPITYQDYSEYYDSKVKDIQNKLPEMFRRTTTPASPRLRMPVRMRPPPRAWGPGRTRPAGAGLLRPLWPARRAGDGLPWGADADADTDADEPEHALDAEPTAVPGSIIVPELTKGSEATDTLGSTPTSTASPAILSIGNATSSATTTTASATTALVVSTTVNATELSLAEKSRQSILKKAKMKERVKSAESKKPPVLLHVRSRQPTVVMVEPGTSPDPWMRARQVSHDAPHTLEKVKRFMRQKLVAGAKNIRDLTDNWDDTVCDYIDVALLDAATDAAAPPPPCPVLVTDAAASLLCLIIHWWR